MNRLCTLLCTALVCVPAGATCAPPEGSGSAGPPGVFSLQATPPSSGDAWHFQEEDDAPSARALIGQQAGELILLATFFTLALVGFFRKSERLKTITLFASVVYLGIYRSELISIVNIFGLLNGNLPIVKFNLGWYLFAGFTVLSTVLWGRLYCGRICAFGAMTQLLDRAVPARLRVNVPRTLEQRAAYVKYVLLAGSVGYFLLMRDMSIYKYVEPFWMFSGKATIAMWCGLAVLLAATVCVRNLYCRFLCPVGAFLALLSNLTVFRIKRWSECRTCTICEKACEWGAIEGPRIIMRECVRCDDCERLYMDQQKCPHWIIIRRKSELRARRSAAPAP